MTRPRSEIAPPDIAGTYHCVQRCVRRAFLCGLDPDTGRSFEHRKDWVEQRIRIVAECFAVAIHAYAVMSNHLHLVLRMDPDHARTWSDDEVTARWVRLFPPRTDSESAVEHKRLRLQSDHVQLARIRQRLGSLSWLMRCLVEPIARCANREDHCKGRFWEGRYKCQALCDERSVLAAMAYGNPPIFSSRQKWSYAARANRCIGVMPPSAIFGRSWLYVQSQRVAVS